MLKIRAAVSVTFLGAFLLALGPGTCCLANPKADTGSQPCHQGPSRTPSKDASHGCCQDGLPCACAVQDQGSRAFLEIPAVSLIGKVSFLSPEGFLPVLSASAGSSSAPGATPEAPSQSAPGVPLYLLNLILLL
jgi:hypothetical protein